MLGAGASGALLVLAACTTSPDPVPAPEPSLTDASVPADLAEFYDQQLKWEDCQKRFECTTVTVPADYADPQAGSLELEVLRAPTENPQGSLLVNPGGPGGSGVEYAGAMPLIVTKKLAEAYDVVGFDPRGVVRSTPVECIDDSTLDELFAADGTPDTPAEVDELAEVSAAFGPGCEAASPDVAPHMDTESAARDMDILRALLGDERLNYLGKSYGTFLGAQYAELFPERVGRVVLDGVLPGSLNSDEITLGQAKAFEVALRRFVEDCATYEDCPLPRDVDEGVQRIQQFLAELDQQPLPGVGDRMLTEALGTYAILSYLYFPPIDWDVLRYGLEEAFRGDGSVLMDMMDERTDRQPDGTFVDNSNEAFYAVSCLDRPAVGGLEHAQALAADWAAEAPTFGPYLAWGNLPCWQWPMGPGTAEAAGDPPVFTAEGSAPILVVSTKYDAATPYQWGVQVAEELDNAALLTFDADTHTAYTSGSRCIDEAVDAYYLDGTLPEQDTVCQRD
jgi:pimeloyl-ACP methyl ester carboxylesterase